MLNDSINRFLGVLCYPFTSMETFWTDQIDRFIHAVNRPTKDTHEINSIQNQLRAELLAYIGRNDHIYSYDEIYLYLEKCYLFNAGSYPNAVQMYLDIMKRMANTLISHRDGKIVFKYWENKEDKHLFGGFAGSNKVTLFHRLNCHIPMDVIAILYLVINQGTEDIRCLDDFYGNIEVADQQLSRLLEKGVAENHLHKGVSRTFSSVWDSLMEPLTVKKSKDFYGKKIVDGTKERNNQMLFYILACGIVRGWLVCRMAGRLGDRITDPKENSLIKIRHLVDRFRDGMPLKEFYHNTFYEKGDREILAYFTKLWNDLEPYVPQGAYQGRFCSIVLNKQLDIHTFDENVFLYHAFGRLNQERLPKDQAVCVMQYLRIRNYFFHITVQQKTIKGLDYFKQAHYSVNSILNHIHVREFWETSIREQLQNRNLHKIEFRFSMARSYKSFRKDVISFLKAYLKILLEEYCYFDGEQYIPKQRLPQAGLIFHLLKRPDEKYPGKCLQNGKDCTFYQFGNLQHAYKNQIEMFVKLRTENTQLSKYLVGIDAASLENSTPVWVFTPIYNQARDSAVEWLSLDSENGSYVQSLGFTFHAGEDFRHILSGLRRIDEAVEHLKFHAGDRIGHGIALGMNPVIWREHNPVIIIPQMEALENYLWAYDTLRRNYSDFQSSILAYMEQRISELSENIFGGSTNITLEMLVSSYNQMFSEQMTGEGIPKNIRETLCKSTKPDERFQWNANLLAAARHCNVYVRKMEQPIHYEVTQQDLKIIETLQQIIKKRLGQKGIVVEVNPSSNTAIADLNDFKENQFYQMNRTNNEQNVMICINSDDPAIFNTNVSNELAYIYYGMLDRNISREAALQWIDRVRAIGIDSSFIRHDESDEMLLRNLTELINNL